MATEFISFCLDIELWGHEVRVCHSSEEFLAVAGGCRRGTVGVMLVEPLCCQEPQGLPRRRTVGTGAVDVVLTRVSLVADSVSGGELKITVGTRDVGGGVDGMKVELIEISVVLSVFILALGAG